MRSLKTELRRRTLHRGMRKLERLVLLLLASCAATGPDSVPDEVADGAGAVSQPEPETIPEPPPSSDRWAELSVRGAPQGREDHTAIWTGSEMIVWGGEVRGSGVVPLGSGARYSPADDSWTPMSQDGAPDRRDDHTAVWTGTEMIVWGGRTLRRQHVGSGARYNPAFNRWTGVAVDGAPEPREDHTAVWTGSEMIVWGGWSGREADRHHFSDGARYDPRSGSWRPISSQGAPDPREDHSAVWTGSEMIVWGGVVHRYGDDDAELVQLASGGRYDPATDTWRPMTLSAAPTPREDHVAVWIGSELFVWGGRNGKNMLANGGRYDPSADRWRAISALSGEPAPRWNHTAVVAGDQVIVWGGFADGYDAAGARYVR